MFSREILYISENLEAFGLPAMRLAYFVVVLKIAVSVTGRSGTTGDRFDSEVQLMGGADIFVWYHVQTVCGVPKLYTLYSRYQRLFHARKIGIS